MELDDVAQDDAIHFLNLTNGLACRAHVKDPRYLRIQSTWCEQKRWNDVLWTLSDDLLMHLASGDTVVVHDVSERLRVTRACWQGLALATFVCASVWCHEDTAGEMIARSRTGMDMIPYFRRVFHDLDDRVIKRIEYYRRYYWSGPLNVMVCPGSRGTIVPISVVHDAITGLHTV